MTTHNKGLGSLKTLNISPYVNEQMVTPTALPTAMPAQPQYSVTIDVNAMAPTMTGIKVLSWKPIFGMFMAGQNTSGATVTVYYQINKNGASYKTGNVSVSNNNYFTASMIVPVAQGDKFDFYLWATSSSGVNYLDEGCYVIPSSVDTGAKYIAGSYFQVDNVVNHLIATGHANSQWAGSIYVYPTDQAYGGGMSQGPISFGSPTGGFDGFTYPLLYVGGTPFKLFASQLDQSSGSGGINQSATAYPNIYQSWFPKKVQYRDLRIG